jgi:hypothetical protein
VRVWFSGFIFRSCFRSGSGGRVLVTFRLRSSSVLGSGSGAVLVPFLLSLVRSSPWGSVLGSVLSSYRYI